MARVNINNISEQALAKGTTAMANKVELVGHLSGHKGKAAAEPKRSLRE